MKKLIVLLFVSLLVGSCRSINTNLDSELRAPAGNASDIESATQASFEVRLDHATRYIQAGLAEITDPTDFRKTIYRHFVRRTKALIKAVKNEAGMKEASWFPRTASPALKQNMAKVFAYMQVMNETEQLMSQSLFVAKLNNDEKRYLEAGKRYFQVMLAEMPKPNDIDMDLLDSARIDLVATLAGQIDRSAQYVFKTTDTMTVRSVMNRMSRLPRLTSAEKNGAYILPMDRLTQIVKLPQWRLVDRLCSRVELPEIQDVEGGDLALARVALVQNNFDMIEGLYQILKTHQSVKLTPFGEPGEFVARNPQQAEEAKPAKPVKAKKVCPALSVTGWIPGQYDPDKPTKNETYFAGTIDIKDCRIEAIKKISEAQLKQAKSVPGKSLVLANEVLYPGLINLHNHTKQNSLPVWKSAKGQFENRFEWRAWGDYEQSVSANMNPWIGFSSVTECAAFRWSELQATVWGTTYLQGPSTCVDNFAIQRVEDSAAFISKKAATQAPTDLIFPNEMSFVWNELGPDIRNYQKQGKTNAYELALANSLNKHCPGLKNINADTVNKKEGLDQLKDKKKLTEACNKEGLPDQFVRYVYWIHPGIAGRKAYLSDPRKSAVIAHLAEGRRKDDYNMKEFELVKMLGLDQSHLNFVHGVGIQDEDFKDLAAKEMGLIWSPFSNLLLYSETLNIAAAKKAGVLIALGSDWVPTGSKSVLEEVKLAREYVRKPENKLADVFTDQVLYQMLTENPAKMLNRWKIEPTEAGIGQLAVGAMGTLIAVQKNDPNPYTNLVAKAFEKDVNLVVIDGKVIYGNPAHLKSFGLNDSDFEITTNEVTGTETLVKYLDDPSFPRPNSEASPEEMAQHLAKVLAATQRFAWAKTASSCAVPKGFVKPGSLELEPELVKFKAATGLDLERFSDLQKVLASNLLTQSRNRTDESEGKPAFAVDRFPALYSCNDPQHTQRFSNFVKENGQDEWTNNSNTAGRKLLREKQKLGRVPTSLGELYK